MKACKQYRNRNLKLGLGLVLALVICLQACNPFAPGIDDRIIDRNQLLGDRRTIDGFFDYFRNTYEMRDSTLYGQLLRSDFQFSYYDFSINNQVFWGRDQEMLSTHNLFRNVRQISLNWNNYTSVDTISSDTLAAVERFFNLVIVQTDQQVFRSTGRARLLMVRRARGENWFIKDWVDNSDF